MRDQEMRAALNQHWAASDSGDFERETQYFADPFEAGEWRKNWVENIDP
jgi:hypothetical protein